jgi:hypothetical protein
LPVSETIVSITRSALSMSQRCARRRTRPRPSNPSASHAGWAARPRRASAAICSGARSGTWPITWPVAGFSTAMSPAAPVALAGACCCTLAIGRTLDRRAVAPRYGLLMSLRGPSKSITVEPLEAPAKAPAPPPVKVPPVPAAPARP